MTQPPLASLRLVCEGSRAEAGSSLQQQSNKSLISELTMSATVVSHGVLCLPDGRHDASYEGRGAHRDVYRIGDIIMKLSIFSKENTIGSNRLEAAALKTTNDLQQTPRLLFEGTCNIESKQFRNSRSNCITHTVSCLLMTYVGPSFDKLMHRCFGNPYDHTVANFWVSAYQQLGVMCIDGRSHKIAYSDLHTANISTLCDPYSHSPGQTVLSVVCDAEGVALGEYSRSVFNGCCDNMIADFVLQCNMARDPSWKFMAASITKFLGNFFKSHGNVEIDVLRNSFISRVRLLWADICKEYSRRRAVAPQPQLPLQLSAQHYAATVSVRDEQALGVAPWRPEGHAHVPSAWSAVQTSLVVAQPLDKQQEEQQAVSAYASKHYANAAASVFSPTRVAAASTTDSVVVRDSVPPPPPPGSPPSSSRPSVEATVPRLGDVPDPAFGQLICGHRANARQPDCEVCKYFDTDAKADVIESAIPLKKYAPDTEPSFEGPRLACGHLVDDSQKDCLVCDKHCASKKAGSKVVAGSSSNCNVSRRSCSDWLDGHRADGEVCQKHYAEKETVATARQVSMSAPVILAATMDPLQARLCLHTEFKKDCMVCVEHQARVNSDESAQSEIRHFVYTGQKLQQSLEVVTEDDAVSESDTAEKQTSTFQGAETSAAEEKKFEAEDECVNSAVSTNPWANYKPTLASRRENKPEELYAGPLSQVVADEIERQRSSKFRGEGRFQEDREGRICWDDRVKAQNFPREPAMTRAQSDDIGRLCKLIYFALHNVLDRVPLNPKGGKVRRVRDESEFKKFGMAMRIFRYISGFTYTEEQWCEPKAVLDAALIEFDHLCGKHFGNTCIKGFEFVDEYERDFLARMITRAFLAHDLCYGRSYGFAYGKAVLLPRDR